MMVKSIVILLGIGVIIFMYNFEMALVTIGMMAPICILAPLSARLMQFTAKKHQKIRAEMGTIVAEDLGNIRTIKAFANEDEGLQIFNEANTNTFLMGRV